MKFSKIIFVFLISLLLLFSAGCSLLRKGDKTKKPDKEMVQYHKSMKKQYEDARKKHNKLQSERTKEMMKKTKKRSRKLNRKHKDSWLKRLFDFKTD